MISWGLRCFARQVDRHAHRLAGMFLLALWALGTASCGKKERTPKWDTPEVAPSAVEAPKAVGTVLKVPSASAKKPDSPPPSKSHPSPDGLRFVAYNVENWLTMDRVVNRKDLKNAPKPDSEKKAVISILANISPDVVGISEIGESGDLAEIQKSLKSAGIDLPHSHYTGGSDPVRHLGLLSRFPITSTAKPVESEFQMKGQTFAINRGFLDATVKARGKSYRFIGVHLKSKREIEGADQEEMRIQEAHLLRRHVDSILKKDNDARLIVYGDFNDTRPSKAFKAVTGSYNDPGYLTAIPAKDSRGEAWTHYWELHDIYSRIDFITVSRAMRPDVDFHASHIIDDKAWSEASDHRPLLAIFK